MHQQPMTDTEIANKIETSRANVGQSLKRALRKLFFNTVYFGYADSALEAFEYIVIDYFGINNEEDMKDIYQKMPDDIKELINNDVEYLRREKDEGMTIPNM